MVREVGNHQQVAMVREVGNHQQVALVREVEQSSAGSHGQRGRAIIRFLTMLLVSVHFNFLLYNDDIFSPADRQIQEIDWFLNTINIRKDAIKPYHDYHNTEQVTV